MKADSTRWRRYEDLREQLFAWNALESSVALVFAGAVIVLLNAVFL